MDHHGIHGGGDGGGRVRFDPIVAGMVGMGFSWDAIFRSLHDSPCSQVRSVTCAYARTDTSVRECARRSMSTAHGHGQCVLAVRVGWAQRGPPHGPLALLIMDRMAGGKVSE